ncbi:hypothetical protein DPMN_046502 [Dreissena polymorpha]|uniref:Globin domain-containing protein n=1 Tax=Dreissena polymorpha TaxID=45954 RepID=A0A9D4D7Z5_DREPO|nr:hypothetical protein DPMN_046502 [Dreissena polymorpha]
MDMLLRHGAVVMKALGAAVESLGDSSCLNSVIITIGQIHCYRNVKPKTIKKLWPCLNYGLHAVLKENYTKEIAQAWRSAIMVVHREIDFPITPAVFSHCRRDLS